ncbi:DUF2293 domain-containing protein [Haloechinothrix salitolerans]|uniref:DUF2293 domain-containing protein n=1 Tax=Haloechinothrix salitolerans TaxID=926830 RepID=A0ABW2C0N5_9PSEU
MGKPSLQRRVARAADDVLSEQGYVAFTDVLARLGWVHPVNVESWRKGRIRELEQLLPVPAERVVRACELLTDWGRERGLRAEDVEYVAGTRDRRPLRFFSATTPEEERALRTHWFAPDAPREKVVEKQSKAPDLVAIMPTRDWECAGCGDTGDILVMDNDEPLCLDCADMGHLVFLPAGDAALTRRAKKASGLSAVVIRWARARQRYERQGILVEERALEQAEEQCLADADARERRRERDRERRAVQDVEFQGELCAAILQLFPGCPRERAESIARHAGKRGSGRVGRSAAGRALDNRAVTLAVVASVRHTDTAYDELLMAGAPREEARKQVAEDIDRVLRVWEG